MGCAKAINANGAQQTAPEEVDSANNDCEFVFVSLDQLERPKNFRVLVGKDSSEIVNSRSASHCCSVTRC